MQRLRVQQLELRDRPLVLFADGPRGQEVVVTHDRQATSLGVRPGMPLAEAKTLTLDRRSRNASCFLPWDIDEDTAALKQLAWACDRFSPVVGLEQEEAPESLLLDITGCGPLFGGEQNLAMQLHQQMSGYGLQARLAVADTLGAAWAIAHSGTRSQPLVIVAGEETRRLLRSLPVTALRLSPRIIDRLHEFQLRRIDQLLALPRSSLPSRFGDLLLQRLDQAFGELPEQVIPEPRPQPIEAVWESETPLQSLPALEIVVTQLLESLLQQLQRRGEGISRLVVQLTPRDGPSQTLTIDCVRPTEDLPHLLELLRLRWERESFPHGLSRVELTVNQAGRLALSNTTLWPVADAGGKDPELVRLIERLNSRLGEDAVLQPRLVADAQPERAFAWQPAVANCSAAVHSEHPADMSERSGTGVHSAEAMPLSRLIRPVWLLPAPIPIEVLAVGAGGPPSWFRWQQEHHIACHWGPERITTGWWRENYIRRDYYHVETTQGRRFWLFRELRAGDWFLHAACD